MSSGSSSPTSNTEYVPVDAAPPLGPFIYFNGQTGQNVANNASNPLPVIVGQRVRLDVQLPSGVTAQQPAWSGLSQNTIASFDGTASTNQKVTLPTALHANCQTFTESCLVWYFVSAGATGQTTESVAYNYTVSSGPATATVYFTVTGPTQPNVVVNTGTVRNEVSTTYGLIQTIDGVPVPRGTVGMTAQAPAPPASWPTGSYSWVQILNQYQVQFLGPQLGSQTYGQAALPALDGVYPYNFTGKTNVPNDLAADQPFSVLAQTCAEDAVVFSATMYLLWTPAPASGCTGTNCTMPVPLGSFNWGYGCDSINTLNPSANNGNVSGWVLAGCQHPTQPAQPQFQAGASYPSWNGVRTVPSNSCK